MAEANGVTISLAMIVRNSEKTIRKCLDSVLPWVDEAVIVDTGSTDNTMTIVRARCDEHKVKLKRLKYEDPAGHAKWISNFSDARNYGWAECSCDMIIWLDADDELMNISEDGQTKVGGEFMREFVLRYYTEADLFNVRYDYAHDASGYCTVCQPRWRVMRRGMFEWVEPVHENPKPLRPIGVAGDGAEWLDFPFFVRHSPEGHDPVESANRNLWIINRWSESNGLSSRQLMHRGEAKRVLGSHESALSDLAEAVRGASHVDEQYKILLAMGDSYRAVAKPEKAFESFAEAERLCPDYKQAYLATAELLALECRWDAVLSWCNKADAAGGDGNALSFNPLASVALVAKLRAEAFDALDNFEASAKNYEVLTNLFPSDNNYAGRLGSTREGLRQKSIYETFEKVLMSLDDDEKRSKFVALVPDFLRSFPAFSRQEFARPHDRPSLAIFCGNTTNAWGPNSIRTGTGGSEESVIYLSRALSKIGYSVEVYCKLPLGESGLDKHGVRWLPYTAWHVDSSVDVFISWRTTLHVPLGENCTHRWIWLQDIPLPEYYTPEVCESVDGILVISDYQKSFLGEWGKEKAVVTANGVQMDTVVDGPNHPNKFIYASSPDRGLEELLKVWGKIRDSVEGAELHIFYGFRDVYTKSAVKNPMLREARARIESMIRQDGIVNHGMVGQPELHKWFAECGWWLYPTSFEESFCITAAKAQCMGAIPVTSREPESCLVEVCGNSDLGPTPRQGHIRDDPEWLDEWADSVIDLAKSDAENGEHGEWRSAMKADARERFGWDKVANQWAALFSRATFTSSVEMTEAEVA